MSKVQCSVLHINAKLDMLVNSALAQQQNRKDDNLVRASDSQPVRPSGDHLARSGHNLTEQAGNGFIPDNMAMELDSGPASSAGHDSSGTNPDERDAMQLIAFEGDEETSPGVSPSSANYVSQCTRKRIDRDHLSTTLRQRCLRPENCESLVVPKVNPGIWKELDKGHRTKDVHLRSTQELLGRGLNAVQARTSRGLQVARKSPFRQKKKKKSLRFDRGQPSGRYEALRRKHFTLPDNVSYVSRKKLAESSLGLGRGTTVPTVPTQTVSSSVLADRSVYSKPRLSAFMRS